MFYIIILIAGIILAANRQQQASTVTTTPTVGTQETVTIPGILSKLFAGVFSGQHTAVHAEPAGPGIGTSLAANTGSGSGGIVSGPYIYRPKPDVAIAGGGAAAAAAPSGTGGGGVPPGPSGGLHGPQVL